MHWVEHSLWPGDVRLGASGLTLMMPPMRFNSSSTSEGETFSRVVATRSTPPSCSCHWHASAHISQYQAVISLIPEKLFWHLLVPSIAWQCVKAARTLT